MFAIKEICITVSMFIHVFFSIFDKFWLHESTLLVAMKKF